MSYTTDKGRKPTIQDFISVLPKGAEVIPTGKDAVVTNCVHPTHDDKKPSMGLMQGSKGAVFVNCFSRDCPKADLLKYFYERIPYYQKRGGRYGR
jgi:hypothetical protein